MLAGVRLANWILGLSNAWKDPLRGWMASWIRRGFDELIEAMEPEGIEVLSSTLSRIADHPATPQDIKDIIKLLTAGKHPLPLLILVPLAVLMFIPTVIAIFQPLGNLLRYAQERLFRTYRFDPMTLIDAWRRDKPTYDKFFDDLRDNGWTDERLEVLKEISNVLPPVPDMVRFADFGAFDPKIIDMWREFYDAPGWIKDPMAKIGIIGEWADKYWFSHWRQPGRYELGEMHRRELINDEVVKNAYLTQGFSSFWQENLLKLVREPWTRVDVRRMWDMRTINEEELRKAYHTLGYYDEQLDGMMLWTKVYVAFPDLIARWKNGWITLDEVKSELTGLGMPAARVEEMIQTKFEAAKPERMAPERDLTKTDIYKGVKKDVISWAEGVELLMDLGYDEDEADYILTINVEALSGSPETYDEFKAITQKYKRATGQEAKQVSEAIKAAGAEVVKLTEEVKTLGKAVKAEEKTLINDKAVPETATAKRDELQVALHRAESALEKAQTDYDSLIAQWKHSSV